MAITFLRWVDNAAQDVHLIPGYVGPRLSEVLWAAQTVGDAVRADKLPAPITVAFAANFTASPATANVAVDASNGRVTVKALPPPPRLLDFVVTATVTEGTNVFRAHRRFRIHGDIARSWLTPDPLSVRQNARNIRFTVLAEFEDGTYGDLTDWSPWDAPAAAERSYVSEIGSDDPAITWSTSAAGTVGVDSATGRLAGAAASGSATITATVGPLPAPAARIATGVANAARPWSDPTLLWLVDGPRFDAIPDG